MGWNNPAMHWKELERRLSGLPGADDAPVSRRKHAATEARSIERPAAVTPYAELHCHSHFSFLDGASSPADLVEEAVRLGLHALAITDHDGFYGAPMLAEAAAAYDLPTVFGAELSLGPQRPAERRTRPRGQPPAGAGARRRGLPPAGRGRSPTRTCAATRRAARSTTSTSWASAGAATGRS